MTLDYDKFKKERISGTKIAPYHMITAVTQRSINHQLTKMHKVKKSLRKLDLKSADPNDSYSELEADLDPPTIELCLNTENRIVIFCLNIKRATLKYLSKTDSGTSEKQMELGSCVLALSVNLAFEGVDFKNLPKDVQDHLKVANNYSVKQLIVEFTSGSLARLDKQRTTIQNQIRDVKARSSFDSFMNIYFAALEKKNDYILSYLPLATSAGQTQYAMPTVAPTALTFQNLPFVVSATDNGKPSEDNMLVYLQMTGNKDLPRELLPISANWVVPTPDNTGRYDGTIALSREIFLAGWLLPKFIDFNVHTTYYPHGVRQMESILGSTPSFGFDGGFGRPDIKGESPLFKPLGAGETHPVVAGLPPSGHWYRYKFESTRTTKTGSDSDGTSGNFVSLTGTTENHLFIPEGYNKDGKCEILLFAKTEISFVFSFFVTEITTFTAKWRTSIILDGVNDGGLIIKMGDIIPEFESHHSISGTSLDGPIKDVTNDAKGVSKNLAMTYILDKLRSVLTGRWGFVFPGAGDLYISKVVFNHEEDLLCELKYKFQA